MSDIILLGTRKGTVIVDHSNDVWRPRAIEHAGIQPLTFFGKQWLF
jgi:hypothetical protein